MNEQETTQSIPLTVSFVPELPEGMHPTDQDNGLALYVIPVTKTEYEQWEVLNNEYKRKLCAIDPVKLLRN